MPFPLFLPNASAPPAMRLVMTLGVVALGAVLGSFVGVIADRWPRGEDFVHGRSRCRACGKSLAARDMIPLISWLATRGRCRHCRTPIPVDALLAELGGGIVTVIAWALGGMGADGWAATAAWGVFGGGLLLLALIDARHFWLPDRVTLPLLLAGLLASRIVAEPTLAMLRSISALSVTPGGSTTSPSGDRQSSMRSRPLGAMKSCTALPSIPAF